MIHAGRSEVQPPLDGSPWGNFQFYSIEAAIPYLPLQALASHRGFAILIRRSHTGFRQARSGCNCVYRMAFWLAHRTIEVLRAGAHS